ncbi:MAG: hypothetical protein U0Q16_29325 [Bryobacteraceae bacterium]
MRFAFRALYLAIVGWIVAAVALFVAMLQPPEKFAAIAAKIPGPVMGMALPFQTLWTIARKGSVAVGDPAPDFDLERLDKSGRVKLTSFLGSRPVVLVFGSYT